MNLDYNGLSELLKVFGLALKVENGDAFFVDVETNTQMKTYVVYKEGYADQSVEYTTEAAELLNGWPFYAISENKNIRLNISVREDNANVYEISKTERKGPHLYESFELKKRGFSYTLEESTYRRPTREDGSEYIDRDYISNVSFNMYDSRESGIIIETDHRRADFCCNKDATTGEIISAYFEDGDCKIISQQEARQLIEQSRVFKDTMRILCPILADSYSKTIANSVGPTK